ncbi:hypothetical protein OS493_010417 [Desmophyllum pertusum]|uniref:Protein kinase domain-containing protein n=1 Tax=Desmophyllum pertusum TaxID=174260 RepID=A0A9X0A3L0_9CNID|nr:hypothetical protein OS493_010417 [Desmophyllum pertusum]
MNETLMFDAIQKGIQVMHPVLSNRCKKPSLPTDRIPSGGSYGHVFRGTFTPPGHATRDVAVKKLQEAPHRSNVAAFLREAAMLKQLEHKHIVTFYGVAMDVRDHKLRSLSLVFELCTDSLKNHIFKDDSCIPWKTASAADDTIQWTKQILDALEFIHGNGNCSPRSQAGQHSHFKTQAHQSGGLGLANFKNRIAGTMCGTTLYAVAPEVYEGKPYDTKVDMYSFGLMMWEMWFGERVFSELNHL